MIHILGIQVGQVCFDKTWTCYSFLEQYQNKKVSPPKLIETNEFDRHHKRQKTKFASKPNKVQSRSLDPGTGSPN